MSTELTTNEIPAVVDINALSNLLERTSFDSDNKEDKIIAILGGVEQILKAYIHSTTGNTNGISLTNDQITEIYDLISSEEEPQFVMKSTMTLEESANLTMNKPDDGDDTPKDPLGTQDTTLVFYHNETILHSVFKYSIADRIISICFNKWIVLLLLAISAIWVVIETFNQNAFENDAFAIGIVAWEILLIVVLSIMLLACNKKVFSLIIKEFDFWMKSYYSIGCLVANSIYIRCRDYQKYEIVYVDLASLVIVLFVTLFSVMEGLHVSWKSMTMMGCGIAIIMTLQAIWFTFAFDEPELYIEPINGVKFGLIAYWTYSYQIISIFLWKQTLMAIWYRGKQCVSIYMCPEIKWIVKGDDVND